MLVGAGQLIEQGCLPAVLVSDQSKGEQRIIRKRITGSLGMKAALFAESGVLGFPDLGRPALLGGECFKGLNVNP